MIELVSQLIDGVSGVKRYGSLFAVSLSNGDGLGGVEHEDSGCVPEGIEVAELGITCCCLADVCGCESGESLVVVFINVICGEFIICSHDNIALIDSAVLAVEVEVAEMDILVLASCSIQVIRERL